MSSGENEGSHCRCCCCTLQDNTRKVTRQLPRWEWTLQWLQSRLGHLQLDVQLWLVEAEALLQPLNIGDSCSCILEAKWPALLCSFCCFFLCIMELYETKNLKHVSLFPFRFLQLAWSQNGCKQSLFCWEGSFCVCNILTLNASIRWIFYSISVLIVQYLMLNVFKHWQASHLVQL